MTEEDLNLIACAALHGARFEYNEKTNWWNVQGDRCFGEHFTQARSANWYLWKMGLRTETAHNLYREKTNTDKLVEERAARIAADDELRSSKQNG